MKTFAEAFDALPPVCREEVLNLLHKALMHRGTSPLNDLSRQEILCQIADVFAVNGHEVEVYT